MSAPERQGFGVQLIERGLAVEMGGEARIDYAPTGLVCRVSGSISRLTK